MKQIALSLGHYPSAPGKTEGEFSEFNLMAPILGYTVFYLLREGVQPWLVPSGALSEKTDYVNTGANNRKYDLAVELHANGFRDPTANGCETLYYPTSKKGKVAAETIQAKLVTSFPVANRGTKEGYYQGDPSKGVLSWLKDTNCPAVILEPGFLSNTTDRMLLLDKQEEIGRVIATSIIGALQLIGD